MSQSPPFPPAGSRAYANKLCDHFRSLAEALSIEAGVEDFGKNCCMMMGVQITESDKQNEIAVRAVGGLRNSIKVVAMIVRLAAKNIAAHEGITEHAAILRVLDDLKNDVLNYNAEVQE